MKESELKARLARYRQIKICVIGRKSGQTTPITDAKAVKSVVEKFREKYGAKDAKKYYSKFDVAIVIELG